MNKRHVSFRIRHGRLLLCCLLSAGLCLSGCTLPFGGDTSSYSALSVQAKSTDEVVSLLRSSMEKNESTCSFYVTDESLVNADTWLNAIPGINRIECSYRRIRNGCNVTVSLSYWDSYPIVYAYRNNNSSYLTEDQKTLLSLYEQILPEITASSTTAYETELAVHDYLVSHISYDDSAYTPGSGNTAGNAYDAMVNGTAICSGYAESFKTLLDMLGIENSTISGTANGVDHIWNEVRMDDGQWYQVDVTWDDPVNATHPEIDHAYFNITDQDMAQDHSWDSSQLTYHSAAGLSYTYIEGSGLDQLTNDSELTRALSAHVSAGDSFYEFYSAKNLNLKTASSLAFSSYSFAYKQYSRNNGQYYEVYFK